MRLRIIWTARRLTLSERINQSKDSICLSLAEKMPTRLSYWVTIVEIGYATRRSHNIPETPLVEVLRNLRGLPNVIK